jgi:hypothetical protein
MLADGHSEVSHWPLKAKAKMTNWSRHSVLVIVVSANARPLAKMTPSRDGSAGGYFSKF